MPRVTFTANLQRHLDCSSVEAAGDSVAAVMAEVFEQRPQIRSYILDDQGRLRRHVNIFVDNVMIKDRKGLTDPVGADEEVFVVQALSGG